MRKIVNNKPTVIDMFSGCGGLSRGFMDAGYEVLLGVDNDTAALKSFKANHGQAETLEADLFDPITIDLMKNVVGEREIDLLVGGPPCQGFSLTGTRDKSDKRNTLFRSMIEAAKEFNPQAFVLENVPGLVSLYKGKVKREIIKSFSELGYNVNFKVLYGPDYGIPQIRRRIFFVGIKEETEFIFPEPTYLPNEYRTCGDAISDLPSLEDGVGENISVYDKAPMTEYQRIMRDNSNILYNHLGTRHTDHVKKVISQVPEGGNHKDLPPGVGDSRKFNEAWTRYHSQKPSKTIDTGHRNHFHYEHNRVPTVRENARLQTFTDDFIFYGNKTEQYRQVGNAVPPLFGYHIAKRLKSYLKIRQEV